MGYNNAMIELNIPGRGLMQLQHLVCDVNSTLAVGAIGRGANDADIFEALELLEKPLRIVTTLRK